MGERIPASAGAAPYAGLIALAFLICGALCTICYVTELVTGVIAFLAAMFSVISTVLAAAWAILWWTEVRR